MNQKLLTKVLATILAVILTLANFIMLGIYTNISYASEDELENQSIVSNNENVKFDAYFMNEGRKKTHTAIQDIDETEKLYLLVNVEIGYLKNAKIQMIGENGKDTNFKIVNSESNLEAVEKIDIEKNTVSLKQINKGTQIILDIPVESKKSELFDLSDFNKINNIKLTGIYVDNSGETINIEKTIKVRNEWKKEVTPVLEQEVKTYIPYEINENAGTILQTKIKTGLENNSLPLKQTGISIDVPKFNGKNPESVIVTSNNVKLVNKDIQENTTTQSNTWEYNKQTGKLEIIVKNEPNTQNKVTWNKDIKDEYIVTYIYSEKLEKIEANQKTEFTIESYNNVITQVKKEDTLNIKEENKKGNFIETNISSNNEISKGYLYSKSENETEYNEKTVLEIAYANLIDKIIVENSEDSFINQEGEIIKTSNENKNYTYYKTTSISKEIFEEILGQDGYIKIIGSNGEQLAIFTKDTQADEKGNYVYNYENEINEIKIETSEPIKNGNIEINHIKSLKGKTNYTKAQIESFEKLQLKTKVNVEYLDMKIETTQNTKDITLIEPSTKIEVEVNKESLSTIVKNEDVEFRVILKTNDISCDLYKNPVIELVLPNYIKELKIKDVNLLFCDQLKIKNRETYVNENGNIVIKVTLEGEQTEYSQNEVSKGANLVINTDITLKKLTPTKNDTVKAYVTNELATSYNETQKTLRRAIKARTNTQDEKAYAEKTLRAVAPTGVVTSTTITSYNSKGETLTVVNEETEGKLDVKSSAKTAKVKMNVINNYNNKIIGVKVLGRIPTEGNKHVITGKDLGTNIETTTSQVSLVNENIEHEIYYSTNPTATVEINKAENGWKPYSEIEDKSQIKSYLVMLKNYEMQTGDSFELGYDLNIPANIDFGKSIYTNYVVSFDNVKENEQFTDRQISATVGLTTGQGPNLEVMLTSDVTGNVEEKKLITYTASIKNVGTTFARNVKLLTTIPEGTVYTVFEGKEGTEDPVTKVQYSGIKEYSKTFEQIKPGETIIASYMVETKPLENETQKTIESTAKVTVENYDVEFTSLPRTNQVIPGYLNANMEISPSYKEKREGQEYAYITKIENVNSTPKENVVVTNTLPNGVTFVGASEGGQYNKETNTVTWNIGRIEGLASKTVILTVKINSLKQGQSIQEITNKMNIKTSDRELTTNEETVRITKPILTIEQSTRTTEKVSVGDIIEYNVTIKNVGETVANNVVVKDYLPEGLLYRGSTYVINGKTYESWIGSRDATIDLSTLQPNETADIIIRALVENTDENKKERYVTNIVGVSADDMVSIGSNGVKHTIVPKVETDDPTVTEPIEGTYKISGLAWFDANNNGKRDEDEKPVSGMEVTLVNSETGKIVKDQVTEQNKTQATNEEGIYAFANVQLGKYFVVFLYDNVNYDVTTYKKEGVIDSKNSDAIGMNVTLDGVSLKAGVANSIEITDKSVTNIDIGLIEKLKFDLKLDKSVSKITVSNSAGTKEYNYNDVKLAKVDLKDKTINGSTVIVEYKIKVTNEGQIPGYVKKIVDYMPKDMKFSSELNSDWYEGESGNLYNSKLANTLLQPGETQEIKLVLTKVMTNENTGTVNNVAEIYEVSNDLGTEDIDSTPANRVQDEDDISYADVIIGVKTGEVYVYILITFICVVILGIGIYFINKKVLRKI